MRRSLAILVFLLLAGKAYAGIMDRIQKEIRATVQKALHEAGIDIDWQQVSLDFEPEGLTKLQVSAAAKDLDLAVPALGLKAMVGQLAVGAQLSVSMDGFTIAKIGPLVATKVVADVNPPAAENPPNKPFLELPTLPAIDLPDMVATMKFGKIDLEIDQLRLGPPDQATILRANLSNTAQSPDLLRLALRAKAGETTVESNLQVSLRRSQGTWNQVVISGKYDIEQGETRLSGPLKLRAWERYALATTVQLDLPDRPRLSVPIAMSLDGSKVRLEVRASLPEDFTDGKVSAQARCDFDLDWSEAPRQILNWGADCGVTADPKAIAFREQLPRRLRLAVNAKGQVIDLDDENPNVKGQVSIVSPEADGTAVSTRLTSRIGFAGRVLSALESWELSPSLDLRADVKKFETLVAGLRQTPAAIPASLNDLQGPISLRLRIEHDRAQDVPARLMLQTRLQSERQTLFLDVEGGAVIDRLTAPQLIDVGADAVLTQIKLELPDVLLEAPPQLASDSRFAAPPPMGPEIPGPEVRYRIVLKTPEDRPVLLLSNLTRDPIPIAVDVVASHDQPPRVQLDVGRFRLNLFRREAEVEHFQFSLRDDDEIGDLDGRVKIDYADYDIYAEISGTVNHTVLKVRSEPPLQESDIYAVLLFGEPMSGVDGGDAGSAASMQAAAASGAVALASLYYLASTPVESVFYNPATQSFSAKMRLGEGMTMSVGREGEETSRLGIRRRLAGSWFVHTYVDRDDATGENRVASFLEWSFAY